MEDALYFPFHRAKKGEITGVGHLSPITRTRVRPTFEIQKLNEEDEATLEVHLSSVAEQLLAWGTRYPFFADFSHFKPSDTVSDGRHCVEYFFECLRQQSMLAIPMTGPESVRGPGYEYLEAVGNIASLDGRGAALRLPFDELSDTGKLTYAVGDSLRVLRLRPQLVDLFLDFEVLALLPAGSRTAGSMVAVINDVLREYADAGFRNIVLCGSSVPERVNKEYNWNALRVERTEYLAWKILVETVSNTIVKFGDYGLIYALEQDVNTPVRPPARIRLSTENSHVFWRAPRKEYVKLCEQVVESQDIDPDLMAWGSTVLHQCARYGRGRGGPAEWVARDTNLHIEVTARAIESELRRAGRISSVRFADPESFPWNQASIDAAFDSPSQEKRR